MITSFLALNVAMTAIPSREITIPGAGGFEIAAILEMPEGTTAKPGCVLLMPGSGPTDRDGNQPPNFKTELLKDLSAAMRAAGFATLRFDKRPVAKYMAKWPRTIDELDAFFSFDNHIADALAVYRWMEKEATLDPSRLAVLGHSEGGMIALELTASVVPKALILMGTPGRRMDEVITEQIEASLIRGKVSEAIMTQYMDSMRETIAALKAGNPLPENIAPGLKPLFNGSTRSLLRGYFRTDGPGLASKYMGAVLVMNGESDIQISPTKDAALLMKALEGRDKGVQKLHISPKASHNFKVVEALTELGFEGPIEPSTVPTLIDWLKTVMSAKS